MSNSTTTHKLKQRRPKFQRPHYVDKRNSVERRRPGYLESGLSVKVIYKGDSEKEKIQAVDKALSQLKKLLNKEGVFQEMKERQYFVSPGRKRYLKRKQVIHKRKTKPLKKKRPSRKKR